MSTIKHPVGPQPSSVYWRRRFMVLIGLVAVIVLIIVLIIVQPGPADGDAQPNGHVSTSAHPGTPHPGATTVPEPPQVAAAEGAPCASGQVTVEAITDASDYADDELPKLSLALTNVGSTSCTMNAGTSQQVYTIKSGKDVYWRSTDCQTDASDSEMLLEPGKTVTSAALEWDRTRSSKDTCNVEKREAAKADGSSYYLSTSVAGIEPVSPKQFLLK